MRSFLHPRHFGRSPLAPLLAAAVLAGVNLNAAPIDLARRSDDWFRTAQAQAAISNVLTWQTPEGSWPKNMDTSKSARKDTARVEGTFDNGATTGELRFLARAARVTGDQIVRAALEKGIHHIFAAQYTNGGWPMFYPPRKGYYGYITFNDNSMVRLMLLMRDISTAPEFSFLPPSTKGKAAQALERAIDCTLNCQVKRNGKLTVWCAQHDQVTFEPRPARAFELASLSGFESAEILKFLMSIPQPDARVKGAIEAGAAWFASHKVTGLRVEWKNGERVTVPDANAAALWARFYDLETMQPIYVDRDGIKRNDHMQISAERRNGYAYLGSWGKEVEEGYAKWSKTNAPGD